MVRSRSPTGAGRTLRVLGLAALSCALSHRLPAAACLQSGRPNIVFLYTDDQARWGVGAYGNEEVHTPNLDRLFAQGATFTNAFTATPVCSPSRAGLIASRYGTEVGITDWINPQTEPEVGLPPEIVTWPELLHEAGYATAIVGKWHLGTAARYHPREVGFDHFMGFLGGGNRPMNPTLEVEGSLRELQGSLPDILVDDAIRFIEQHRAGSFAVCVHFRAPHAPYAPVPEEDSAHYAGRSLTIPDYPNLQERVEQLTREYYASISSVDRNVGRLLDALDEMGLAESTIVIFTSDHGYNIGHHGIWHKGNGEWITTDRQGRRPNMFEESIRVPLAVRWPGVVTPGMEIDETVTNLDFYPTILRMTGTDLPDDVIVRGRDFVPLLLGQEIAWDPTLFGQYDMHNGYTSRMRMIRTPEWKLVLHFDDDYEHELYHLASDPGERENRYGDPAARAIRDELESRLIDWMQSIEDPLLERVRR